MACNIMTKGESYLLKKKTLAQTPFLMIKVTL